MVSVLIVDDSAFMRKAIQGVLEKDSRIEVVATAYNGLVALEKIRKYKPDVVTMDIEMPKMDGLTALKHIMEEMPCPVIMISSLTTEGAEATLKALELGAVDFVPKVAGDREEFAHAAHVLQEKVVNVARKAVVLQRKPSAQPASAARKSSVASRPVRSGVKRDIVAIGVSTGGPPAVQKILSQLPEEFPAGILIAQHMPAAFTGPFAKRLDKVSALHVKEAQGSEEFRPGNVYVAPGGKHVTLQQSGARLQVKVQEEPKEALYKPSANELMESVGLTLGHRALGVILTGMGSDGKEGMKILKNKGGRALAQSDTTCVVYGMPKAIVDGGLADEIIDIDDMAEAITDNLYK